MPVLFFGFVFLFFFQLTADFIESIYTFGLLGTDIPPEIVSVLLFFTPLLLLIFRRRLPHGAVLALAASTLYGAPIRTLILSGQNNHNWRVTTPYLQTLLTDSGRFDVKLEEEPAGVTAATLANYDLIVVGAHGATDLARYLPIDISGEHLAHSAAALRCSLREAMADKASCRAA